MESVTRAEFSGHDGSRLAARLERPAVAAKGWALFAHCFSCSKDIHAARRISAALVDAGYGVMRFDFTGLGHSEGDFANTNFSTNVQDLIAAARWLEGIESGPHLLIGHSLGGAAVVVAAEALDSVRAVATINAPSDAEHVLHNLGDPALARIEADGEAEVSLAGRPFRIQRQFVEDVRGSKVREAAARLKRPLLVLHAPLDQTVGIENATGLFVAAKHPKSFISLDDADHLLTREADAIRAGQMIAAWADPYMDAREPSVRVSKAPRDVRVAETGGGKYEARVTIGSHTSLADEPVEVGGGGKGPDPYEYVSAGLGACTAMTLRMYANRKDWPLSHVSVSVSHAKEHAADCADCENEPKVDVFRRTIQLDGPLSEEQRTRLMEIADRCPVHRTLEQTVAVKTEAAERV